jgi:dTDP-glucose 4,6-dehydratase
MARILITGGAGFIGTNLRNDLRARGHDVWTLDITPNPDPQHMRLDVTYLHQLEQMFSQRQFDFVYHLAAEYGRWNGEDHYDLLWRTNVVGTKNMLLLQDKYKYKMIFFSSAEVYGDYMGKMSEDVMEKVPIKQMNDYAITKWAGEMQCLNHADMFGVEVVRVRPVNCYGPHEHYNRYRGVVPVYCYRLLHGLPVVCHKGHLRIFDYVGDTARTFANIVDNFIPGEVYNVGSNEDWEISIEQLAEVVLKETGADPSLVTYKDAEAHTTMVKHMDFSKIRRDLDHRAEVDIEEGIARTVAWMRKDLRLD